MVKRKLSFLFTFFLFYFFSFIVIANPNTDQWIESDKTYKDLIDEGFEVKSYAINNLESSSETNILLFVTILQKQKEIYECQEYQIIDKAIKTLDMKLVCKQLVQPYLKGLGT